MKRKIYLSLMTALLICNSVFAKKEVVFVTPSADSRDSITIQAIAGFADSSAYNVTVLETSVIILDSLDFFNAADAVIMGRMIGSSDVGSGAAAWDSITSPVLSMNMWGLRGLASKAWWTPNDGCTNVDDQDTILYAKINDVDDPVFKDFNSDSIAWWNGNFSVFNIDADANDAGNGTLLAETVDKRPLFIRWEANVEFYPGANHAPKGERTFIGCGSDNDKSFVNLFGFSALGEDVFFNELARMTGYSTEPEPPVVAKKEIVFVTPSANSRDTITIQAIAAYKDSSVYNVTILDKSIIALSDTTQLNAADVVIMGRHIGSSDVGSGAAVWDSITSPVISMNMWGLRGLSAKAWWTPSNACDNITDATSVVEANILVPSDPVFVGVSSSTFDWWSGIYSAFVPDEEGDDAGNGTLLVKSSDNRPLFIRWDAGVEFYPGAGHAPNGERTFIGCGSDNSGLNYFGFSEEGKTIFFNELARMADIPLPKREVIFVKTPDNQRDSIVIDAIASYKDSSIYNVTVLEENVISVDSMDFFNSADVVIMGRSIGSKDVGSGKAAWDSISSPVISINPWGLRGLSDRAMWTPSTSCENITDAADVVKANILLPNDPVFEDLTADTLDWWTGINSIFGVDAEGDDAGNGTLLAETADKRPLFIRWAAGIEFYPGAGHAPNGDRAYIGNGSDNSGLNYFGFTPEAEKIFFNELARMASGAPAVLPKNTNANLGSITSSEGRLTTKFDPDSTTYQVELPFGTTEVPSITAEAAYIAASVDIIEATSFTENTIITVNAEDTTVKKVYTIQFTFEAPKTDATLSELNSSAGQFRPDFDPEVTDYTLYLPPGTSETPTVSGTATDEDATLKISNAPTLSDQATITVTAQDTTVSKVYTITINVVNATENNTLNAISVYPSPVKDELHISNITKGSVQIYTTQGTLVKQSVITGSGYSVNVADLLSGTYIIKVQGGENLYVSKFIKL